MSGETETRLDEFDADEWFDVCRVLQPEMTREAFEVKWAEFQRLKAEHERQRAKQ